MKPLDMTPIIKRYPGCFVALSDDRTEVLGKGATPEEALKEAKENGAENPILTRIPEENRSYLL